MAHRKIECASCSRELSPDADGVRCPDCGAVERRHLISVADEIRVTDAITQLRHVPSNEALAKRLQFEASLDALEAAMAHPDAHTAQRALKQTLETLHELNDLLQGGAWSRTGGTRAILMSGQAISQPGTSRIIRRLKSSR
jgi:hypothetical protein